MILKLKSKVVPVPEKNLIKVVPRKCSAKALYIGPPMVKMLANQRTTDSKYPLISPQGLKLLREMRTIFLWRIIIHGGQII